ncbi:MAG TPA: 16S rRNA (guanine(527)-N(7))-methyltransferase RsmG [Terriglobia bacterium]|nr:16S rRNA (guanine(527)-N(7))-methyltransferase RsmG [Terriglobia bacterium]
MNEARITELLEPFEISLNTQQMARLEIYLRLLMRWNQKINLTSIRDEEECVTRHFGESFYLSRYEKWTGETKLLDIGSGAGFPGLALKLIFPEAEATLLEAVAKKRAFLKEVVRACGMGKVSVCPERIEQIAEMEGRYDAVTARAVGNVAGIITGARKILKERGKLHLWLSGRQSKELSREGISFEWVRCVHVPLSRDREIVTGVLISPSCA